MPMADAGGGGGAVRFICGPAAKSSGAATSSWILALKLNKGRSAANISLLRNASQQLTKLPFIRVSMVPDAFGQLLDQAIKSSTKSRRRAIGDQPGEPSSWPQPFCFHVAAPLQSPLPAAWGE